MVKRLIAFLIYGTFGLFSAPAFGQNAEVWGYFMEDSLKIGQPAHFVLKARYPEQLNVVFPDSTYSYAPFVLLGRQTFPSSTSDGLTLDSVVYRITHFEMDSVLSLALPVFALQEFDSLIYEAEIPFPIATQFVLRALPESLDLLSLNTYQEVPKGFNIWLWGILGLVFIAVLAGLLYVYGDRLRQRWRVFLEKRRYKRFKTKWQQTEEAFLEAPTMEKADELLGLWRAYMQHLNQRPFREWTASEIADFMENKALLKEFRAIEAIIYAAPPLRPKAHAPAKN
ncbi:hypothetical protein A3SI_04317 [Nitritalea halalkaliphila LW7]|uniref:BatD protein n=1 Tax=Nitritalea halalkaliphila LW7 TaxID=1189621 RepID=I5C936_9BACT|nr:hypothetical protein [Nitritalea halalkaliphila]EIM78338.1 hypothetical protein A3SI_04317 [Nitritalea halalkaliphila LW7]